MKTFNFMDVFDCNEDSSRSADFEQSQFVPLQNMVSIDNGFRFVIDAVFDITCRGIVVVGKVENESIHTGASVHIKCCNGKTHVSSIKRIEYYNKVLDEAEAGEIVGLVITGISKSDVNKGDIIVI